jgi:hypothetical protein
LIKLISLDETIQPLVDFFNSQSGNTRLLAFVSPT